jgi:hypothetical protein
MTIVSLEVGHVPLLIVHTNVLLPTLRPVTPEEGLEGEVTAPPPPITLHVPVPDAGVFPASVDVAEQTD